MTKSHKETLFYRFSNLLRFVFRGKNQVYCSCNHDACHITRKCPFGRFTCKHRYYFLSKSIEILRKPPETMYNIEPRRPVQRSGRTIEFMSVCPSVNSSCKHEGVVTFYRIPSKKVYISKCSPIHIIGCYCVQTYGLRIAYLTSSWYFFFDPYTINSLKYVQENTCTRC